jgi:hypothetical protein
MKSLGLDAIHFRILTIILGYVFQTFLADFFRFKNCFTPQFLARKPGAGSCVSQRAVAFQSGPDAKNLSALKGSSANQIASFSLIKNNNGLLTEREVCTVKYQTKVF